MKTSYKFGQVQVEVEAVGNQPYWQEYRLKVWVPGIKPLMFQSFKVKPITDSEVAQGVIFSLVEAWRDPMKYISNHIEHQTLYAKDHEMEMEENRASKEAMEVVRFANDLDPFIAEANKAVWASIKMHPYQALEKKSPRDWLPRRK